MPRSRFTLVCAQELTAADLGLFFLVVACAALFVGVQVMFEVREEELRHGVRMKC